MEGRERARVWNLSCADWAERIRTGGSLIPELPLSRHAAGQHACGVHGQSLCRPPPDEGDPLWRFLPFRRSGGMFIVRALMH